MDLARASTVMFMVAYGLMTATSTEGVPGCELTSITSASRTLSFSLSLMSCSTCSMHLWVTGLGGSALALRRSACSDEEHRV